MSFKKKPEVPAAAAEAFIKGAETTATTTEAPARDAGPWPWTEGNPRILRGINLRLPEPLWLKMDYIRNNTPLSMQGIIMQFLEKEIDKQLEGLIGKFPDNFTGTKG